MERNIEVRLRGPEIHTDYTGLNAISSLGSQLVGVENTKITVNLSSIRWMEAHLAPLLLIIIRHCEARGNWFEFVGVSEKLKLILSKNGFFASSSPDIYNTTLRVTEFHSDAAISFSNYTRENLARPEMPKMTAALRSKFYEGIDELFANCALHSEAPINICAGGQFYPRSERLCFTIVDGGIGMDEVIYRRKSIRLSSVNAIDWAMTPGNTTRQGDIPGGLGLKIIRAFIESNSGKLLIVSNSGYWCQNGSEVECGSLVSPFPGTAVILDIVTSDHNHYDLAKVPDPRDIW
ncbi:ATP-binding protein [Pseudovibrio sp. Alg231-02]|uniref:ATP-binding protein n=1 Tax=Pseudovibrio sp. Alg231-02 TaxID=1922223 RepID=UPI000D54D342|nr:ATP-binding protein [Pseudovibrio sp. Alg231-02]